MFKKLILTAVLFSFFFLAFFSPLSQTQAAGLVPCGGEGEQACQLCHFFILFKNVIEFVLFKLIPPLAVLYISYGGLMLLIGRGDPGKITQGKEIMTSVIIGLGIIFAGWLIINLFFMVIGVEDWTGLASGWFQIKNCPSP